MVDIERSHTCLRTAVVIVVLLGGSSSADAQENARVVTDAYIYLVPDGTRKPYARLEADSLVTILAAEGDWFNITIVDTKGETRYGYVRQRAIERLPPTLRTNRLAARPNPARSLDSRSPSASPTTASSPATKAPSSDSAPDAPSTSAIERKGQSTQLPRVVAATRRGDTLTGLLKHVNSQEVVLVIAGQDIRLGIEELRYVSFAGTLDETSVIAPTATGASTSSPTVASISTTAPARVGNSTRARLDDALKAFAELRAATEIGMLRAQYSEKLVETMTRAKAFTDGPGDEWTDIRHAMLTAMHHYQEPLAELDNWKNASTDWSFAARWVTYGESLAATDEPHHQEDPSDRIITVGQTVSGRLGYGDRVMPRELDRSSEGQFNDVYQLTLRSPARVAFRMSSGFVNTHLTLLDVKKTRIEADGGVFGDATIKRNLPAGTYYVWAGSMPSSFSRGSIGSYTLSVSTLP